jgi:hypothetical protein
MGTKLKEEMKKLGLRVRPRTVAAEKRDDAPGRIAFDDRGNAQFAWGPDMLADDSDTGERLRDKALAHPGLAIADEEPPPNVPIRSNPKGLRLGYNPYESGLLAKKEYKRKRNLHELSRWIDMKRKLGGGEK